MSKKDDEEVEVELLGPKIPYKPQKLKETEPSFIEV